MSTIVLNHHPWKSLGYWVIAVALSLLLALASLPLLGGVTVAASSQANWSQFSPTFSPDSREGASMAFDPATGQLLLFGGFNNGAFLSDTWTWDGTNWNQLSPTFSPAAREDASMALDPATGQLLLFGGTNSAVLSDTWTWNGTNWSQLAPTFSPAAREGASMTFNPTTGRLILFGGSDGSTGLSGTWAYLLPAPANSRN
jgi:hypothetical protein